MIDGELDPAAIRRVLVHAEVCASCGSFFRAIRMQARAHGVLWQALEERLVDGPARDVGFTRRGSLGEGGGFPGRIDRLAARLVDGRALELAKIFYQMGRAYVHLVVSPDFYRAVECESVPIPEYQLRGRELVEQISDARRPGAEAWVRARSLLNGVLDSVRDNLEKGSSLLEEALDIKPLYHEARIYLGHARELSGRGEEARVEFRRVLRSTRSRVLRSFAMENLGNSFLIAEDLESAIAMFRRITTSGILEKEPRFFTALLNLAAACARAGRIAECSDALATLDTRFPEKRDWVRDQISSRPQFRAAIEKKASIKTAFARKFPAWFGTSSDAGTAGDDRSGGHPHGGSQDQVSQEKKS
jgi:tetratricopeptide (TPR) repeat protein